MKYLILLLLILCSCLQNKSINAEPDLGDLITDEVVQEKR